MNDTFAFKVIARIYNDFPEKFGIPRQSGLVPELESMIVFEEAYRNPEALRGIEGYSHLWLIWQFSENLRDSWSPTVRPPRLGGNRRMGVFATRSPFRPNAIGLSSVRLLGVERTENQGHVLRVCGADLMNGTPIFDVKPYIAYTDAHPDAVCGFVDKAPYRSLAVEISPVLLEKVPIEKRAGLLAVLENDPRPHYQRDPERVYRMSFGEFTVSFTVCGDTLSVTGIE